MNEDDFREVGSLVTEMTTDDLAEMEANVSALFLSICRPF